MKRIRIFLAAILAILLFSCEKMVIENNYAGDRDGNVVLHAVIYTLTPQDGFTTRAEQPVANVCSTLSFVVYQDGKAVKNVTQRRDENEDYGQMTLALEPGDYQLLVLGHSSVGTITLTNPEKITFANKNSYSDTFMYYEPLVVGAGDREEHTISLKRAASACAITILDELPSDLSIVRLYYEGESGVLDATKGRGGTTNSKQTINYDVEGLTSPLTLNAYTFLREDEGKLNITITAFNTAGDIIAEKTLTNVPMRHTWKTEYSGYLFSTSPTDGEHSFTTITADPEWQSNGKYDF